jgi:hypothetical protein
MTQYSVTVSIASDDVLAALQESGYRLQAYRAVTATDGLTRPLLWKSASLTDLLGTSVSLAWNDALFGYVCSNPPAFIAPGNQVTVAQSAPVRPGQVMEVMSNKPPSVRAADQPSGAVQVYSSLTTPRTCGLASRPGPQAPLEPFCVLPLPPGVLQDMTPAPKVLLLFSTDPAAPGTVAAGRRASGGPHPMAVTSGLVVTLGQPGDDPGSWQRAVSYDGSWSAAGDPDWATPVPAVTDIVSLMTQ